jgi:hypothetical protein
MSPISPMSQNRENTASHTPVWRVVLKRVAEPARTNQDQASRPRSGWKGLGRLIWFFCFIIASLFVLNWMINSGLHRIKTSQFGVSNEIVQGKINADIIISGSSRAISHYDPRVIEAVTGRAAFNLGRNGSQTDIQVAVLKTYLRHNRHPKVVIQNLDAFSFITTREVYDPAQYMPYLGEADIYNALRIIDRRMWWKTKYLPLYGYAVDDMRFNWLLGLKSLVGSSPEQDFFLGFNPRVGHWTAEFENFKASHADGTTFAIEPAGVKVIEDLIQVCHDNGVKLVFVYSPEYQEMQTLTKNRAEIFEKFHELSERYNVPLWDFSDWSHADDQQFFRNSQHLNAEGAEVFSKDLANRLAKELPQLISE